MAIVLVIVHNRSDLRRISDALTPAGYEVLSATDGLSGFELFQQRRPDVVVISLLIPKVPGGELCQRIKGDPAGEQTPVVLIGGAFKKTDMAKVALDNWRADRYLQWPFEPSELLSVLNELLAGRPTAAPAVTPPPPPPPPPKKAPAGDTLEEMLAATLAELESAPLIDRAPKVAQIDEEIAARAAESSGGGDKIGDLLNEMAAELLDREPSFEPPERVVSAPDEDSDEEEDFPHEGQLEENSVVELFAQYYFARATGILELSHRGAVKNVYFYDGRAVYVESEGRQESLGQVLVRHGIITNEDLLLSLENMAAYGRRQGDALVEMGRLNPMQLYHGLRLQMREKLLSALGWFDGEFYFDDTGFDISSVTVFELPMPQLIYDGILQHYEAHNLREMFADVADQVIQRTRPMPISRVAAQLPEEVWAVYGLIDGRRTIGEVVAASGLSEARVYPILYTMVLLRLFDHCRETAETEAPHLAAAPSRFVEPEPTEEDVEIEFVTEPVREQRPAAKPIDQRRLLKAIDEQPPPAPAEKPAPRSEAKPAPKPEPKPAPKSEPKPTLKPEPKPVPPPLTPLREPKPPAAEDTEEPSLELDQEIERELRRFEQGEDQPADKTTLIDRDDEAAAALREEVMTAYLKLGHINHYQVLGVSRDADEHTVKYAYYALVKRMHPDRLGPGADPDLKEKANAVMQAITQAYEVIGNLARRAEYDKRLTPEGEELKERRITTILAAERAFNQGNLALRRQNYVEAEKYFAEACKLFPEEAEYHAYLGWARWNDPRLHQQQRAVQARESLERSLKINPKGDKANFFLGKLLLMHGNKDRARQLFALALRYNKNNEDARAELLKLQRERERERQELNAEEEKDKFGNLLKKDLDFQSVKKAIKKIFW